MSSLPYMPFYIADYMRDAGHLPTLAHGAYFLLLANYWQRQGPIPADDFTLQGITKLSDGEWERLRPHLLRFFREEGGMLHHKRVDQEIETARGKIELARSKGKRSAEQRLNRGSTPAEHGPNKGSTIEGKGNNNSATRTVPVVESPRQRLWAEALPALMALGVGEKQARPLIGKWLKSAGDDCDRVRLLVLDASEKSPMDPIGWITAAFAARASPRSNKVSMLDVFNEIGRSDEPDYLTPDYSVGGFNDPPNVARIGSGAVRR